MELDNLWRHSRSMSYRFRRQNPIEEEKLAITKLVAQALKPRHVLDAFAGDGTSTRIYCKSAQHVLAIEKDRSAAACILKSSRPWKRAVVWGDNLALLPLLAAESFDLVDLDPYGTCYPQLEHAGRLLSRQGAIMVTSGEIQRAVRGLKQANLPGASNCRGRRAVFWTERIWIPFLLKTLDGGRGALHLIHFFASPVLTRVILGTSQARDKLGFLTQRKKYLGWFEAAVHNQVFADAKGSECENR
jgi:Conserved hypothetical protein 95